MPSSPPIALEPFVGAGGMAHGLRSTGFVCAWACDMEPRAVATAVAAGFPAEVAKLDDAKAVEIGRRFPPGSVDLVAGGPPCQGLSVAGKGLGKYDPRDGFPAMLALVREVGPRAVLIENVQGLTSRRHRPYLDEIVADLEAMGHVVPRCPDRGRPGRIHDAADWGAPQRRHRILIVAFRDAADAARFRWPEPTHFQSGLVWAKWGTAGEGRGGIAGGSYWAEHGLGGPAGAPLRDEARVLREILAGRMEVRGPRWRTVRDALGGTLLAPPAGQSGLPQSRRAEDPDRPSSAIQGGGEESGHAPAVLGIVGDAGASRVAARGVRSLDEPSVAVRGGSALKGGAGGGVLWALDPGDPRAERAVDMESGTPAAIVRNTALHRAPEVVDPDLPAKAIRDEGRDQFLTEAQVAALARRKEGRIHAGQGGHVAFPDVLDAPSRSITAAVMQGAARGTIIVDHGDLLGLACRRGRTARDGTDRPEAVWEARSADEPAVALRGSIGGSSQPFMVIGAGSNPRGPGREEERSRRDVTDEPAPAMTAEQIGNRGPWIVAQEIRYPVDGTHGSAGTEPGRLDEPSPSLTAAEGKGTRAHAGAGRDFRGGPDRAADGMFRAIGLRRLSPAECARLQSFPDSWPWQGPRTAIYKCVGNACVPPLAEAIGLAVLDALASSEPALRLLDASGRVVAEMRFA